jgi:hypothetical protein
MCCPNRLDILTPALAAIAPQLKPDDARALALTIIETMKLTSENAKPSAKASTLRSFER